MKIKIYFREFSFFKKRNWYGVRKGKQWSTDPKVQTTLLDIGAITIAIRKPLPANNEGE